MQSALGHETDAALGEAATLISSYLMHLRREPERERREPERERRESEREWRLSGVTDFMRLSLRPLIETFERMLVVFLESLRERRFLSTLTHLRVISLLILIYLNVEKITAIDLNTF